MSDIGNIKTTDEVKLIHYRGSQNAFKEKKKQRQRQIKKENTFKNS